MKNTIWILIVMAFVLPACSSSTATPAVGSDTYVSQVLDTTYDGAISVRNQLALGTLQLEEAGFALSSEQAQELLPLWQALRSTTNTTGSSPEEMNAVLAQIESAMTQEQLQAIKDMGITQTDFQEWAKANGITLGSGSSQPGAGKNMTDEQRATKQAEMGITGGSSGGTSTIVLDRVIAYLQAEASD